MKKKTRLSGMIEGIRGRLNPKGGLRREKIIIEWKLADI
jgi:hypothetical protein